MDKGTPAVSVANFSLLAQKENVKMNPRSKNKNSVIQFFHFPKLFFSVLYTEQQKNIENKKNTHPKPQTKKPQPTDPTTHKSNYTVAKRDKNLYSKHPPVSAIKMPDY